MNERAPKPTDVDPPSPKEVDIEFELAARLISESATDPREPELPDSIVAELSPEELWQFQQARECLDLLNFAVPSNLGTVLDLSTVRDQDETEEEHGLPPATLPHQIGRFEVIREIGRGGFGVVLLAQDPQLNRQVALKIPRGRNFIDVESRKRFEREARAAAILSHPAIVPVFESGRIGPINYVAFEYCQGISLADWIEQNGQALKPQHAAEIISRLADAVQHAHARGVIHRDLKPANILVETMGGNLDSERNPTPAEHHEIADQLRITDFGLAQFSEEAESLTKTGAIVGTPAYMSPEQAKSENEIGASSDVYSLGAILFQLLTNRLPFSRPNQLEILKAICDVAPPAPRKINSSVPRDLSAICLKCLEKKPADRYASAQDLNDDLQRYLRSQPVVARESSVPEKLWQWCSRNPALTSIIVLLATSTVVMSSLWMNMKAAWKDSSFHEARAEERTVQALTQSRRLRHAVNELLTAIATEPSIKSQDMEHFRQRLLTASIGFLKQLREDVPHDDELRKEYLLTLRSFANIHDRLDDQVTTIEICEEALAILESDHEGGVQIKLDFLDRLARSQRGLGRFADAEITNNTAIELATSLAAAHPAEIDMKMAMVMRTNEAANNYLFSKNLQGASIKSDQAFQLMQELHGKRVAGWPTSFDTFQLLSTRANLFNRTGRAQEGIQFAKQALAMFGSLPHTAEKESTFHMVSVARVRFILGVGLSNASDHSRARDQFQRAVDVFKTLEDRHPNVADYRLSRLTCQCSLALTLLMQSNWEQAEIILRNSIASCDMARKRFPQSSQRLVFLRIKSMNMLQSAFLSMGRFAESRDCLHEAMQLGNDLLREAEFNLEYASEVALLKNSMGMLNSRESKHRESMECYMAATEMFEKLVLQQPVGEVNERLREAYFGIVAAADLLDEDQVALEYSEKFLNSPGPDSRRRLVRLASLKWLAGTDQDGKLLVLIDELENEAKHAEDSSAQLFQLAGSVATVYPTPESPSAEEKELQTKLLEKLEGLLNRCLELGETAEELNAKIESDDKFSKVRANLINWIDSSRIPSGSR